MTFTRYLLATAVLALGSSLVFAQQDDSVPDSGYAAARGEAFFLLADASYGSDEEAKVRLEAPGRDYRRFEMEGYGGADIRLYRIDQPLAFLQKQKNLHRIQFDGVYRGEGLSNALSYLWDHWYKQSRRAMQRVFSVEARREVTAEVPALKTGEAINAPTRFEHQPQFAPIADLPLIREFRYPLWDARPIAPPEGVQLAGSSSEFIAPQDGNVHIPLGKLKPGLYLVEALIGRYRAHTVLFVSNTVAITKIAGQELLVWTASKREGRAVPAVELLWSDGLGVMSRGRSDADGLLRLRHVSPERSYVLGQDGEGGVFVSENFYYDSEIYDTKLYAFTDRPLYRPGDWVEVKILGREFKNARDSVAAVDAPIELSVLDANGTALQTLNLQFTGISGADTRFQLPVNATAGGYELRFAYRGQAYSAAFRVAEYIKPHFEIALELDKPDYRSGEPVNGWLQLLYPDGRPVAAAHIQVSLRAQQLSMVDNELQYLGQFPVQLTTAELRSDDQGRVRLELPAAEHPSRYLLTVFASDGAAFRVKTSKEILIERAAARYRLTTARRFTAAGESVDFALRAEGEPQQTPVRYEWVRLEDQARGEVAIEAKTSSFSHRFDQPGTYNLMLKDQQGLILGALGHSVSGPGLKAPAGSIEVVFDQAEYLAGQTASALITFDQPVSEALLTLERDAVEATALLSRGGDWLQLERLNDTQLRARIPVREAFAPNLTFSVLTAAGGDYSFQNAGIKVAVPSIELTIRTDREVYAPGETVSVEIDSRLAGKPVATRLSVAVVDEMIYALQPEIAPSIGDFFYHPRRNNVRTAASLSFISYDLALPGLPGMPPAGGRSERGVKVLERPRRDEVDTAAWLPDLRTDAQGKARFSFVMPDSLTRWRITARAMRADGVVGQRRQFLRSEQPLYLKWSGPTRFRSADRPALGVLAFNQADADTEAELVVEWKGEQQRRTVALPRGLSYLPLQEIEPGAGELRAWLEREGAVLDRMAVALQSAPADWQQTHSLRLQPTAASTPLQLPADASAIELRLAVGSDGLFRQSLDDLLEYPWGCVEQTASRLLPLSMAFPQLSQAEPRIVDRLRLSMQTGRLRLVQMAGPEARFGWWGEASESDAFLTGYAYYADWFSSRSLDLRLPDSHWQRVLQAYSEQSARLPLLQRALLLDFAATMELPVKTLLQGLLDDLAKAGPGHEVALDARSSLVLEAPDSSLGRAAARVLAAGLARELSVKVPESVTEALAADRDALRASELPFAQAAVLHRQDPQAAAITDLFARLAPEQATLERALVLSWLYQAGRQEAMQVLVEPDGAWQRSATPANAPRWQWQGDAPPVSLEFAAAPTALLNAQLSYASAAAPASGLGLRIERRLWRLRPGEHLQFQAEPADPTQLQSDALYLDEVTLVSEAAKPLRYGLLELPLPPGAEVERTTWGLQVSGLAGSAASELERARSEPGQLSYAVPLDTLEGTVTLRHLLRFSQKGEFALPPARYQRMYAPDQHAFEAEPALARVQVR